MSNQTKKNSEGFLSSLIGEKTPSKKAGLTYTVSALAIFGVSFLLLLFPLPQEGEFFLYLNYLAAPIAFFFDGVLVFFLHEILCKSFYKRTKMPLEILSYCDTFAGRLAFLDGVKQLIFRVFGAIWL